MQAYSLLLESLGCILIFMKSRGNANQFISNKQLPKNELQQRNVKNNRPNQ